MAKRNNTHKARRNVKKAPERTKPREPQASPAVRVDPEQLEHFRNRIAVFLKKANGRPVSRADLASKCRGKGRAAYLHALSALCKDGLAAERRSGYVWAEAAGMIRGKITRLQRTFGFAAPESGGAEVFIAGRDLKGSLPGDTVLLQPIEAAGDSPEAAVVSVISEASPQISGVILDDEGTLRFLSDKLSSRPLSVANAADWRGHIGEKAIAEVVERGDRHSKHVVRILQAVGSADTARACAEALVAVSGAPTEFSAAALADAERMEKTGITEADLAGRLDLRGSEDVIFTIDGFDAKDLDDAISVAKTAVGYRLGVHIADVSHYVKPNSPLDEDAIARGTSIYYADQVIPMLPKALSNGICSLHPDVDRLTLSALMELDADGALVQYRFEKTVIRSAVKGVYREVNALLDGNASAEIGEKYAPVRDALLLLDEIRALRLAARKKRGAPEIETEESAFLLDENGVCTEVTARNRGKGEELIEECMLLANEAAARLAREHSLPFVYRVHAKPPEEKVMRLAELLNRLNIPHPLLDSPKPQDYAKILQNAENSGLKPAIHQLVLRSMAKADYETEPAGHFGLALRDYTHFTSPIRRYPDLAVHRILSAWLSGAMPDGTRQFAQAAAAAGSVTEQRALQLERDCDDRYRAEWARQHIGETFDGVVSGVSENGIYVMLPNTVEGLVLLDSLPLDDYDSDGFYSLHAANSGAAYTLGMALRVTCIRADINSGNIDFSLAEPQ
ncbi:MAG: VacB/RNase II family 3'-5' exoribonuclease [Oscillospiraceae bacterium]|nr:VacB/RNase II family 3'-5' exoribonuclease [Oscillospiraceae bacterium]